MPLIDVNLIYRLLCAVSHIHELRLRQLNITPSPVELDTIPDRRTAHGVRDVIDVYCEHVLSLRFAFRMEHHDFEPLFEDHDCTDVCMTNPMLDTSLCVNPYTARLLLTFKALQQVVLLNMLQLSRPARRHFIPTSSLWPHTLRRR